MPPRKPAVPACGTKMSALRDERGPVGKWCRNLHSAPETVRYASCRCVRAPFSKAP